jgi:acyl-CoA reductase-like NAD-dependent aldehyde dehydrogenase
LSARVEAVTSEVRKNLVNGEYAAAAAGRTSPVVDPSTGEEYARAPVSGTADVEAAVHAAARGAYGSKSGPGLGAGSRRRFDPMRVRS